MPENVTRQSRDARAIDFLIDLNEAADKALRRKAVQGRYLFPYFSSARKTARIFALDAVRAALPLVAGKPYQFWRSRSQIFAYAFNKSAGGTYFDSIRETTTKVKEYQKGLREIALLDSTAANAARRSELQSKLREVESFLRSLSPQMENLGFVARIESYKTLAEKRPKQQQLLPYFEFFRELYANTGLRDQALARIKERQAMVSTRSRFGVMVPRALREQETPDIGWAGGSISSASQRLPNKPNLTDESCKAIVAIIAKCYRTPLSNKEQRDELFDEAYTRFLELDSSDTDNPLEHELVRCMLYLAMPFKEGIENAYELLVKKLVESQSAEVKYVLLWAARLAKHFAKADEVGIQAHKEYKTDPRFPHGRLLNIFEWLKQDQEKDACPYTWRHALEKAELALSLYKKRAGDLREELGVMYNNLAYLQSYQVYTPIYNLDLAEQNLKLLEKTIPKIEWDPLYPEYFHTSAHLRFEYFKEIANADSPELLAACSDLLAAARKDIDNAIKLYNKPLYAELKREIKDAARQAETSFDGCRSPMTSVRYRKYLTLAGVRRARPRGDLELPWKIRAPVTPFNSAASSRMFKMAPPTQRHNFSGVLPFQELNNALFSCFTSM